MQEMRIGLLQRMPILFRENQQGDPMFVLEKSEAAVLKSWHGRDYLLQTLKEGDCFGEMAVMDHRPRSASVRTVEDCTAIQISAANLHQVDAQELKQCALIQMNMGREVCRRLRQANSRLFNAKMGTPRRRSEMLSWPLKERISDGAAVARPARRVI